MTESDHGTIVTTITSTVLDPETFEAHHLIEIDFPDEMPNSLARAVAQSAARAVTKATEADNS